MPQMIVHHEVKDFAKWKSVFDLSLPIRKVFGERSSRIFHNTDNYNDVTILFDWQDPTKAIEYAESEDLRASLKEAGVVGDPQVYLLEENLKS